MPTGAKSIRNKVRAYRERLRARGLREPSRLMVDKITSVPKSKLGSHIGQLDASDLVRVNRAVAVFLGLAAPARSSSASADSGSQG